MTTAPIYNFVDTWNDAGVTFSAIKVSVTDTASAAGSKLIDFEVGGVSQASIGKDGGIICKGLTSSLNIDLQGNRLVLDADNDTYLEASTDDRLDFVVGGTLVARFDANAVDTFQLDGVGFSPTGAVVGQALGYPNSATTLEPYTPAGGGDLLAAANETVPGDYNFTGALQSNGIEVDEIAPDGYIVRGLVAGSAAGAANRALMVAAYEQFPIGVRGHIYIPPDAVGEYFFGGPLGEELGDHGEIILHLPDGFTLGSGEFLGVTEEYKYAGATKEFRQTVRSGDTYSFDTAVAYHSITDQTDAGNTHFRYVKIKEGPWTGGAGSAFGGFDDIASYLSIYRDVRGGGNGGVDWRVTVTPFAVGSGAVGAPTEAQSGTFFLGEHNMLNRLGQNDFAWDRGQVVNWCVSEQYVPEVQDFEVLQPRIEGTSSPINLIAYDILSHFAIAASGNASTTKGESVRAQTIILGEPNAIAAGGRAFAIQGHRSFVKTITISTAGSGYAVGDEVTVAGGTGNSATFIVKAVNGSGGITDLRKDRDGRYSVLPSTPASVTGGTGTGAQVALTFSDSQDDAPFALLQGKDDFRVMLDSTLAECTGDKTNIFPNVVLRMADGQGLGVPSGDDGGTFNFLRTSGGEVHLIAPDAGASHKFFPFRAGGNPSGEVDTSVASPAAWPALKGGSADAEIVAKGAATNVDLLLSGKGTGIAKTGGDFEATGFAAGIDYKEPLGMNTGFGTNKNIWTEASNSTAEAIIRALADDYNSSFTTAQMSMFGSAATGTTDGFANADLARFYALNPSAMLIGNNNGANVGFSGGNFLFGKSTGSYKVDIDGDVNIDTGHVYRINGTSVIAGEGAAIADLTTTATTGTLPTANGSVTIANAASPTNAELLEYCVELEAKMEAMLARMRAKTPGIAT